MIDCWQSACRLRSDDNECKSSAFNCHEQPTFRNMTLPYDLCPINPQNATLFDFGIFLNVLQPGIAGSTDYLQKLSNCFLWSLRNLRLVRMNVFFIYTLFSYVEPKVRTTVFNRERWLNFTVHLVQTSSLVSILFCNFYFYFWLALIFPSPWKFTAG